MVYKINLVGLIANAILDYVMIFGNFGCPALGVAGAGYATSIATAFSALYGAYLVFNEHNEKIYRVLSNWKFNSTLSLQFLKFGLPSGMQWALEGMAFTVFLIVIGHFPNGDVAQAVMTLVGQNLGNKNPTVAECATKDGIKISQIYMACIAVTFFLIPEFYISWFKTEENLTLWTSVSESTVQLLRIVALFTILDSFYLNISFALKGAGDTRFVSLIALIIPWPLFVVPTYLIRHQENPLILAWFWVAGYSLITALIMYLRFRQGKWKTMSVIQ